MFKIHPYLVFHGEATEAIQHYSKALDLEVGMCQTYLSSGESHAPEQADWIMHAELLMHGECMAMLCDQPASDTQNQGSNKVQLSLNFSELSIMKNTFEALSQGGEIKMPLALQFWGSHFGMLTDKYGFSWMMNCVTTEA